MNCVKLTIVTVTYNCRAAFEKTLRSVECQSYGDVQYIVVDGGSTDGTLEVIRAAADRGVVCKWVSEPDSGIYDAMNKGVAMADGQWINFLNAGDCFAADDVLQRVVGQLPRGGGIAYGNHILELSYGAYLFEASDSVEGLRTGIPFCHQAVFAELDLMRRYGFRTKYSLSGDYDFFYRCYADGVPFFHLDVVVVRYEASDGASVRNRLRAIRQNGAIRGESRSARWLIGYWIMAAKHHTKNILSSIAPRAAERAKRRGIERQPFIKKIERS